MAARHHAGFRKVMNMTYPGLRGLSKEDLTTLALMLSLSYRRGDVWVFEGHRHNVKLMKLLFLVAHGVFNEESNIVDLRDEPRIKIDFAVYLFGVATSQVYDIQARLQLRRVIMREDLAYSVFILPGELTLDAVLHELERRDPELAKVTRLVIEKYSKLDSRELTRIVNNLLGLEGPAKKAILFGASVRELLRLRKEVRELLQRGLVVDE